MSNLDYFSQIRARNSHGNKQLNKTVPDLEGGYPYMLPVVCIERIYRQYKHVECGEHKELLMQT
jgi:hypothetical protein